ncbi:MAG: YacP-like domain [Pseudomonadota bacterium]|jgi:hypothetical protein
MKLDGEEVPEVVLRVWKAGIDGLSSADVRLLAVKRSDVIRGFRPASIDIRIARERLKDALSKSSELPADIRAQLRATGLANSLLLVLSQEALERIASPLAAYFGTKETAAALLLDDRLAVRDMGRAALASWDGEEPTASRKEAAAKQVLAEIGPFVGHLQELMAASGVMAPEVAPTPVAAAAPARAPRLRREAELVVALRGKRQEVARLAKENTRVSNLLSAAANQASTAAADLTVTGSRLNAALQELGSLKAQFDARLEEAVSARLNDRLLPWLEPAESLERGAGALGIPAPSQRAGASGLAAEESDAIRAAELLLDRQAAADRQFGLRSAIRAERERCAALLERLRQAQADSIRPLAELGSGAKALEARIRQIDGVLGAGPAGPPAQSPALRRFESALAGAGSLDKVAALRQHLIASEPLGLLGEEELDEAFRLLDNASSRMYALAGVGRGWTVGRSDLSGLPLYALQATLAQGRPCTLVVDGHNVLWKVPTLFRPHYEKGQPGGRARRALEAALQALAERQPDLTIHLWFDGGVMEDRVLAPNLRVHFSGGVGANRADRQMLAYLAHLNASRTDEVRAVTTADGEVAATAQASGALAMTPQELAIWMA